MACRSCGLPGVEGTCSMCYGDPYHNTDGEYLRMLEEDERRWREKEEDARRHEKWMQEEMRGGDDEY